MMRSNVLPLKFLNQFMSSVLVLFLMATANAFGESIAEKNTWTRTLQQPATLTAPLRAKTISKPVNYNQISGREVMEKLLEGAPLVRLENLDVVGEVSLTSLLQQKPEYAPIINKGIQSQIEIRNCIFRDTVNLSSSAGKVIKFSKAVSIKDSTFEKDINFSGDKFRDMLSLDRINAGALRFDKATLSRGLRVTSTFLKLLSITEATIVGDVIFSASHVENEVNFSKMKIDGKLRTLMANKFPSNLMLEGAKIDGREAVSASRVLEIIHDQGYYADFRKAIVGELDLSDTGQVTDNFTICMPYNMTLRRTRFAVRQYSFMCGGCSFSGRLMARISPDGRDPDLRSTGGYESCLGDYLTDGEAVWETLLPSSAPEGISPPLGNISLYLSESEFNDRVDFAKVNFGGDVYMENVTFNEVANFANTSFGGKLFLTKAYFSGLANFTGAWLGGTSYNRPKFDGASVCRAFFSGATIYDSRPWESVLIRSPAGITTECMIIDDSFFHWRHKSDKAEQSIDNSGSISRGQF